MKTLFDNKHDLFQRSESLGFANLQVGETVSVKVPVWQKIDTYSREKVIEGYRTITGIIKKLPKKATPRSFVEIQVGPNKTEKVTINNFRQIDDKNCYLFGTENDFVLEIQSEIEHGKKHDKRNVLLIAKKNGIEDETVVKELYETAVLKYLKSHYSYEDVKADFYMTVEAYKQQMSLTSRTSNSILLQQYSTPAPIAYLAGAYIRKNSTDLSVFFEPSAGNGLLTLALPELQTEVNEIDKNRHSNLVDFHNFRIVGNYDASKPIPTSNSKFDGIVTNPPFGKSTTETISGYKISKLEHIMSIRALDMMKDSGRAAIIIGGHTEWDKYGRVQMGSNRIFLSYLYHFYNVEDIININGSMYAKQGTTFPIRLILISERKSTPGGTAPLKTESDCTVNNFDELWQRMSVYFDNKKTHGNERLRLLEIEMEKDIAIMEMEVKNRIPVSEDGLYQIREVKVKKNDGSIVTMFAVPTANSKGLGDKFNNLFDTIEEAIQGAKENRAEQQRDEERDKQYEEEKRLAAEAKAAKAKANEGKTPAQIMQEARAARVLDTKVNFDGVIKTKRQFIDDAVRNGLRFDIVQVDKIKDVTRAVWNRMNEREQYAFEKKREEAGKTNEYRVYNDEANRMYFVITKTEYDYAETLKKQQIYN